MNPATNQHETRVGDTVRVCKNNPIASVEKIDRKVTKFGLTYIEYKTMYSDREVAFSWIRVRKGAK